MKVFLKSQGELCSNPCRKLILHASDIILYVTYKDTQLHYYLHCSLYLWCNLIDLRELALFLWITMNFFIHVDSYKQDIYA